MIVAELVLLALGILAMVLVHRHQQKVIAGFFTGRLQAEEDRRVALYKREKASQTVIHQQQKALEVLANQSRALHEETRLMHQRTDAHFAHPNVKRLVNEGGE